MNFWDTIVRGEYVMIALAVLLIVIIIIWWVRAARLNSLQKKNSALLHRVRDYVVEGDIENAVHLTESLDMPGARVISAGLHRLGHNICDVTSAMDMAMATEDSEITKGNRWLKTLAVISPLLGFGGTLAGICDALERVAANGVLADISMLSQEVAPCLVTSIAGLGVGVIAIVAYSCLSGLIAKTKDRLHQLSMEFIDLLNEPS